MSSSKEMTKLRRELQRAGWHVEKGKKHYKCYHPNGQDYVAMACSPSDPNAHLAARKEIKRLERKIDVRLSTLQNFNVNGSCAPMPG